ncbi:hypothetical protein FNV43_RR16339 [Rhamnella rubrinervis]|uniref:MADS-box domain-containing protein n=1 Tax=Rhamnella rubrinervis TaxID=2594499 RepID=A0A8K0GYL8_9ROSA|nr:hypothetical protein FNV43_RR16339 [Rhamnella rubrinervis]
MGKGKRKIGIEKIENDQYRMVTFSKRRKGLFKKAQEFNSKTGSSIAILVLSQAGRPYVFGAPSFDAVADHFLSCSTGTHSHQNDLVSTSAPNSLSTTTDSNDPEPWWLPCDDDGSLASTSYANGAVCSSVTDSDQSRNATPRIQNNGHEEQFGVWLGDKFGITERDCESVEELVEMKNALVQLRQAVASEILSRHGPETFFV